MTVSNQILKYIALTSELSGLELKTLKNLKFLVFARRHLRSITPK